MKITNDYFGKTKDGQQVTCYSLANSHGINIKILDFGATITEINVPDKNGVINDINLGFNTVEEYEEKPGYIGGFIGRVANRIGGGEFTLDDETYKLYQNNGQHCLHGGQVGFNKNNGQHCLHGGQVGFNKKMWTGEVTNDSLILKYVSPDGEENFPGELIVTAEYQLNDDNEFLMLYTATTSKASPVNLTEHTYINLAGHDYGCIKDHIVTIPASYWLPLGDDGLPTGERQPVEGSDYDLRLPTCLADVVDKIPTGRGFENYFCLEDNKDLKLAARVEHPPTGRYLELHTTEPGLQFYTSYYLPEMAGKNGATYKQFCAIDLEAQHYPDSIHQPNFPTTVHQPGKTYTQKTVYTFGIL
ncbi:aldose 1-epimerase [Biomphalaria pfeifferi]|uniref:Aldose 1-epimerase n=1 Tax=Biomphalaria pfeifferi TaxID=112525 RepID=A0AAD8BCR9_BIOPF|nr:aldose 1-epimerase [Biomphalaria pfeifferi]